MKSPIMVASGVKSRCRCLNRQPMGFYAPSQLVQDARRHRVEVRPVDITVSLWDCTLEEPKIMNLPSPSIPLPEGEGSTIPPSPSISARERHNAPLALRERGWGRGNNAFALSGRRVGDEGSVRLGFCIVSGLAEATAQRIVAARAQRRFESVVDLARRAQLNRRDLKLLAASRVPPASSSAASGRILHRALYSSRSKTKPAA
jgi:error-prone DNA polymerase